MTKTVSAAVLARLFVCEVSTIERYAKQGIIAKVDQQFDQDQCVSKIVCYFRDLSQRRAGGASGDGGDQLRVASIAEKEAKTRKVELEIAEKEGQLIDAVDVQQSIATMVRKIAVWIDSLPDMLERLGELDKKGVVKVREECDVQRHKLYDQLQGRVLSEQFTDHVEPSREVVDGPIATPESPRKRGRPRISNK